MIGATTLRRVGAFTALAVLSTLVTAVPADAAPDRPRPALERTKPVPGHAGKAAPRPADEAGRHALRAAPTVTWPAARAATVDVAAGARAGELPIWVAPAKPAAAGRPGAKAGTPGGAATETAPRTDASRVRVEVLDRAKTAEAGVDGLLLRVARADGATATGRVGVTVDYSGFRYAYGGDWSSRLRLVELPACAASTPALAACQLRTALPSSNDEKSARLSAELPAGPSAGLFAVTAGASGSAGDFGATSLSASATWQVSEQTGDFNWTYPIDTPPVDEAPEPEIALGYSSGRVDGRTASTNNQVSWVGEGMDFWPGFVERKYNACSDDGVTPKTGDLCWGPDDNATLMLDGDATELVKDATTGEWHPKSDDGVRVERVTGASNGDNDGEYWRVTDTEGVQYYFGMDRLPGWASGKKETNSTWTVPVYGDDSGEACHGSTYAASWCQQAWRWNLDYVVDPHGNAMSYWYTPETNYYARAATTTSAGTATVYTRGGYLSEISYGQRSDTLYSVTAPARVQLNPAERCIVTATFNCTSFTKANAANWPDVPFDANCDSGAKCTYGAPTFWSRKRLASVVTQVYKGSAYASVDTWTLTHTFPASGDGTSPALWLSNISHSGNVGGTATVADVTLSGVQRPNRVDATEGLPPLTKWRVSAVTDEVGGALSVTYSDPECVAGQTPAPDNNSKLCFPQYWTPDGAVDPQLDWFHKYVVTEVSELDATGGAPVDVTTYDYLDAPAWHFDDDPLTLDKYRTWGQWRGYSKVRVVHGDPASQVRSQTDKLFFRGMDGDKVAAGGTKSVSVTDSQGAATVDALALQGFAREEIDYTGAGGTVAETELTAPWVRQTATRTRAGVTVTANLVRQASTVTRTALSGGGWVVTQADTAFDDYGLPTQVDDRGDVAKSTDDVCTRTTYARNTTAWLIELESRIESVSVACAGTPRRPDDVITDVRNYYDDLAYAAAPTKGDITRIEDVQGYSGGNPVYRTEALQQYDTTGRVTAETDAGGFTTWTAYTPATGGPATKVVVTNALDHTLTTNLEPAWGVPLSVIDENSKRTSAAYDPLGRVTGVWLPGRDQATQSANIKYSYLLRPGDVSAVGTSTLRNDGSYTTSYELYDAQMRPRQTQEPAQGGGRLITDTYYDARGLVVKQNQDYYADGNPSTTLFLPDTDAAIPGQLRTVYDGLERETTQIFLVHSVEKWRNTVTYDGDRETVSPPNGASAVTRISDARDNVVETRQYKTGTPTGSYDTVRYGYTPDGELASVTDASGNVRRYTYDLLDRRTKAEEPDSGTVSYGYDERDLLTSTTDGRGRTLAYTYDKLGRKTAEYDGSTSGPKLAEWTWDTLAKGQLTSSARYVNGLAYRTAATGYTDDYQQKGSTVTIPAAAGTAGQLAGTYSYTSEYNLDGSVKSNSLPAAGGLPAETMLYGYDELGEPTTLHGQSAYVTGTTYSKLGQISRRTMAGSSHVWQRDFSYEEGTNRLVRTQDTRDVAPYTLTDRRYGYDASGNITKVSDAPSDTAADAQCFRYDYVQRLTEAWTANDDCAGDPSSAKVTGPAPYWQSFRYDVDGDRTARVDHATAAGGTDVTRGYTYPAAGSAQPHAVQSVTVSGGPENGRVDKYGYDPAGNTVSRTLGANAQILTWDAEGMIATATAGGKTSSYLYDADGALLISQDSGGATLYLPEQQVRVNTTGGLTGERYYTHADETVAVRTNSAFSWLMTDPQGTSTVAVDTATQAVTRRYFAPFGDARSGSAAPFPGAQSFVGGTTDPVTGLIHLGAREYDASIGRFVSVDPITVVEDPQEMQGYAYAANNPVLKSDPDGQCWICKVVKKGAKKVTKKVTKTARSVGKHVSRYIPKKVKKLVKKGVSKLKKLASKVKKKLSSWKNKIKKLVSRYVKKLRSVAHRVVNKVHKVLKKLGRGIHFDPGGKRAPTRKPDTKPTPRPSPRDEGGHRPVAPQDLYVGGNTTGPKPAWREGKEYDLDGDGEIPPRGGSQEVMPNGISVFADRSQAAQWSSAKRIWKIPKGTPLPDGFEFIHDGPHLNDPSRSSHHTFYNTRTVSPDAMLNAFKGLGWTDDGPK